MNKIPEYTLDRPLSVQEHVRRKAAYAALNSFMAENKLKDFEMREIYAATQGAFVLRTPSFDWSVEGRTASIGYAYDAETTV